MDMFHHHSAGFVRITSGDKTYNDTVENFITDYGYPLPELVPGAVEQIYHRGVRHCMQSEINVLWGGPTTDYEYGDNAIDSINALLLKKQARDAAKEAAEQEKFQTDLAEASAMIARGEKYMGPVR